LTWELLQDASVASRYQGTEFKHVLVDEFQDTNNRQWDIIRALANVEQPGSLFLVGDPRQSIYQFRGADVRVFNGVRDAFKQVGGKEVLLNTSFRTHKRLAEAFNTIFAQLMVEGTGPNKDYYVPLEQPMKTVRALEGAPCLEMILIDKDNATEGTHGAEDLRRWEARTLAERLWAIQDSGLTIWDKHKSIHRPIEFGDMAVLFQSSR